jgi:hypothetical protein
MAASQVIVRYSNIQEAFQQNPDRRRSNWKRAFGSYGITARALDGFGHAAHLSTHARLGSERHRSRRQWSSGTLR